MQISSHISKSLAGERQRDLIRAARSTPSVEAGNRTDSTRVKGAAKRVNAPKVAVDCARTSVRSRLPVRAWR